MPLDAATAFFLSHTHIYICVHTYKINCGKRAFRKEVLYHCCPQGYAKADLSHEARRPARNEPKLDTINTARTLSTLENSSPS